MQWLFGPLLALVALAWLGLRLEAAGTFDAILGSVRKMSVFQRFAAAAFLAVFIVFAGEKTNAPNVELGMENVELSQLPSPGATSILHSPFSILNSFSGLPAPLPAEPFAAPPDGATTNVRWRVRGAFEDAVRIPFPGEDGFPWRGGVATALTAFACGEFRPDAATEYFPAPFGGPVSLPPLGRQDANAPSAFWHATTPSNSLVVTWENALHGRDAACPTNFQAEFFADGSFIYRYPDHATRYPPVLPFDYDGDGLENSVDPEPEVPGPDAHGTNAQWYNTVCSNILVAAEATNCVPPVSLAWKGGVNSNAYYFVDVVAERGPAPIRFMDANGAMPDDPVVVARAGEVCRVPLVIGVEYAVTSAVPFTVSHAYGCEIGRTPDYTSIRIRTREGGGMTVHWPIRFSYVEKNGSMTEFALSSSPEGLELEYSWHVTGGNGQQHAPSMMMLPPMPMAVPLPSRLLGSPDGYECFTFEGSNVTVSCSGDCGCGGCTLGGTASHVGHSVDLPGFTCGCSPPPGDPDPEDPPSDPSLPSISVSLSAPAVIYEAAYVNAPGETVAKRSTLVTVNVSVNSGEHGARFGITKENLNCLVPLEGVLDIPASGTLEPFETLNLSYVCVGASPSGEKEDVRISGWVVDSETGARDNCNGSKMTVFRVAVEEVEPAIACPYPNRHTYGIAEKVRLMQYPATPAIQWDSSSLGSFSSIDGSMCYDCPITQTDVEMMAGNSGVSLPIFLQVIEPDGIACDHVTFLPATNEIEGCGMQLKLVVLPCTVSFTGLKMQEVPADLNNWQQWGSHSGYFASYEFYHRWCHTTSYGAGKWLNVSAGNVLGLDVSRIWSWPTPWASGVLSWKIPYGWKHKENPSNTCVGQISPPSYSIWTMNTNFLEKTKHSHRVGLSLSGQTYLDGNLQEGN